MTNDELELAIALERHITGGLLRLPCNCRLEVICTMPYTYWVRVKKYDRRCPLHPKKGTPILKQDPCWLTPKGELISRAQFAVTFYALVAQGAPTVPGFIYDQGRKRDPSLISVEGGHYIIAASNTQKMTDTEAIAERHRQHPPMNPVSTPLKLPDGTWI